MDRHDIEPAVRARLGRSLRRHRVTVVTAGAGFGKTTLLRAWSEHTPSVLITVTPFDRTVTSMARTLVDGLLLRLPNLAPALGGIRSTLAESVSSALALAAEFGTVFYGGLDRDVVLMLDDIHELEGSESAALIDALLRHAPPNLHWVLSGRNEPPVRLARLKANGEVDEVTATDLAFTRLEVREVLRTIDPDITSATADDVHDATKGWPVAVRLAGEAIRHAGSARLDLSHLGRPGGTLFDYLAEEVMSAEDEVDRRLLETAAVAGEVDVAAAEAAGVDGASARLARLIRRGVYFDRRGDRLHLTPLVEGHVRQQPTMDAAERRRVAEVALEGRIAEGRWSEALELAVTACEPGMVATLCAAHGAELLRFGGTRTLLDAISRIPPAGRTPDIDRLEADARQAVGEWDAALAIYRKLADRPIVDAGLAWRMGLIHHMRGELDEALEVYRRGRTDDAGADVAMLLGWWAAAVWVTADRDMARSLAERALEAARGARDDRALANAHTVMAMVAALEGDREGNDAHYLRALEHAERCGDVWQQMRIHANRGSRHQEEGSYPEAVAEDEQALRLAELTDDVVFKALALLNRGQARVRMGAIDEAAADFQSARALWQGLGARQEAYALVGLGDVHRLRGDRAEASNAYRRAVDIGRPVNDVQALVPALSGLAIVLADADPEEAMALAKQAVGHKASLAVVDAHVALARTHLAMGDRMAAAEEAEYAAGLARARHDRAGLASALQLAFEANPDAGAEPLVTAHGLWQDIGDPMGVAGNELIRARILGSTTAEMEELTATLTRLGARGMVAEARHIAHDMSRRNASRIRIVTLGRFAVEVDGVEVPVTVWQSKKARDVLKILIAHRGAFVHRERLLEMLWPGEDPAKTSNRLSVALSLMRSVLEVDDALSPVKSDRSGVRLDLNALEIDVVTFLDEAHRGLEPTKTSCERRRRMLERAEAGYLGDFLPEDLYEQWSIPMRDESRAAYLSVVRALAAEADAAGEPEVAARHFLRVLEVDPYDEAAHIGLIAATSASGQHGEARRLYRQYSERMAELEIEPAPFPA